MKKEKITLYYNITEYTSTLFVTNPSNPGVYRGLSNRYMTNCNYTKYTKDIITIDGVRTPGNGNIPNLYNETITIISEPYVKNYITASANYIDIGEGFETILPDMTYNVESAIGKFKGYKKLKIIFNNVNKTRIVEIS